MLTDLFFYTLAGVILAIGIGTLVDYILTGRD
jgi:hypothetical protein